AEALAKEGIEATVVNARFVKPLDAGLLLALARTKRLIVTVEEAYLAGGFGSAVAELLEENGLLERLRVVRMGVPDRIITHGDPKLLLAKYGLDADGIYTRVKEAWEVLEERRAGARTRDAQVEGELLLRVSACGVCRTDLHVVEGELAVRRSPVIPGHQVVGRVAAVGAGAEGFGEGDRVGLAWLNETCGACRFCRAGRENLCERAEFTGWTRDGGYAELVVAPAQFVYPLPVG